MRNYLLTTLIATAATLAGQADGFRPQVLLSTSEEAAIGSWEDKVAQSRENLARLAKEDSLVLQRFDQFVSSLAELHHLDNDQKKQILEAVGFAAEKHQFQTRKNEAKTPYISHPIGVANNLMDIGKVEDPAVIIAALLHDTVEDTQTSFEEITKLFGKEVSSYVREVTDNKELSVTDRKRLQVIHAAHKSAGAAQIKLADKLYNLTDLSNQPPKDWGRGRTDQYFEWAESVVNRLPPANPNLKKAVDEVIKQYWKNQEKLLATK